MQHQRAAKQLTRRDERAEPGRARGNQQQRAQGRERQRAQRQQQPASGQAAGIGMGVECGFHREACA